MPRILHAIVLSLAIATLVPPGHAATDGAAAEQAAGTFARALLEGNASLLRPILPRRGKVQLRLVRMGPEEGYFSASQVEALFGSFLKSGSVRSFEVSRVEQDREGFAVVHGRATITDREGRLGPCDVRLGLQPEGERWVLREIREAPR